MLIRDLKILIDNLKNQSYLLTIMSIPLKNQTVFISGAGRGLGSEIAKSFHREGSKVIINYRKSNEKINYEKKYIRISFKKLYCFHIN